MDNKEKEYVEKDALLNHMRKVFPPIFGSIRISNFEDLVQHFPAANVREIKYGEWYPIELDDDDYKADCCYRCSECGFIRDAYLLEEDEYCPKCGSKMRYDH